MIVYIGSAFVLISIVLLFYIVSQSEAGNKKIRSFKDSAKISNLSPESLNASPMERISAPVFAGLAKQARRITPTGMIDETARKIIIAGMHNKIRIEVILAIKLVAAFVGMLLAFLMIPFSLPIKILAILGAGYGGFIAPDARISSMAQARQKEIAASLPETIDQLSVTVEAGLSFDAAINHSVANSEGPMIDEFAKAVRVMRLGVPRDEAFDQIVERTDVPEVKQFINAVKQAVKLGVPMANILSVQSSHMREIKRLKAEEKAMQLPVKLTFPMVFCLLPSLFVILLGPVAIKVMDSGF